MNVDFSLYPVLFDNIELNNYLFEAMMIEKHDLRDDIGAPEHSFLNAGLSHQQRLRPDYLPKCGVLVPTDRRVENQDAGLKAPPSPKHFTTLPSPPFCNHGTQNGGWTCAG